MATASIRPLAWEPPYAAGVAVKDKKAKKKKRKKKLTSATTLELRLLACILASLMGK